MKISDFLIENNIGNNLEKEIIVSNRFADENGNFIPFKVRSIDSIELKDIKRLSRNDEMLIDIHLVANACVEPNFNSVELQNHYGVKNAFDLVQKVLLPGEINILSMQILKLSGYGMPFEKILEEAKKQ